MGNYSGRIKLEFEGTKSEKQMMEKLLRLMEPGASEEQWQLPINDYYDYYPATALLGILHKKDDSEYNIAFGDIDPLLAPKLFAALFPASKFSYSIKLEYSVTIEDTPYITATYDNNDLMIRKSYLYSDNDSDKIERICRELIDKDPAAKEKYEQYCEEYDIEEEEDTDWFELLNELVDNPDKIMASLYKYRKMIPSRNTKYEKSFFEDGDLQEYLVSEQIRKKDMSLMEYVKALPFTEEQFQKFIEISADCGFAKMHGFLLEERQNRIEQSGDSYEVSHVLMPIE